MERKVFDRGAFDLMVGVIIGGIMGVSQKAYFILWFVAVIAAILMSLRGNGLSTYGEDKEGKFSGLTVLVRVVTVNVGVLIGQLVMKSLLAA